MVPNNGHRSSDLLCIILHIMPTITVIEDDQLTRSSVAVHALIIASLVVGKLCETTNELGVA